MPWAQDVLREACRRVGLDPSGARLVKFTSNAVYELVSAPVIVRIPGSEVVDRRVPKVISVARWLADEQVPAVRLAEDLPQPLTVDGRRITFWHKVISREPGSTPNGRELGMILRRLHALPPPGFDLPPWRPLAPIRGRLEEQDLLSPADLRFLEHKCDDVEEGLEAIEYTLPPGPIHGDSTVGNLIPNGREPVLCDFDATAHGPREWDLAPVAFGKVRFASTTGDHERLAAAYGMDILRWQHFPVLRQLRELQLVTSVLPILEANPALYDQWRHRFLTFRAGDNITTWSPYR
ncbi:hypothetical protein AWN90_30130 [Nocardia terpenica]|uniref:Aminoglycoside phosphotransferase domain-containing protein n=1 Tax=Nocardia terpenica TaxID=455432 RepID=A0A164M3B7_9NOCA|nr:hypothetical protein AWN90_30130 [Nocardia terpenica]NQE92066.1 aminoglycoside phosphotransferase family protein [Nocardia terpenica]